MCAGSLFCVIYILLSMMCVCAWRVYWSLRIFYLHVSTTCMHDVCMVYLCVLFFVLRDLVCSTWCECVCGMHDVAYVRVSLLLHFTHAWCLCGICCGLRCLLYHWCVRAHVLFVGLGCLRFGVHSVAVCDMCVIVCLLSFLLYVIIRDEDVRHML